MKKLLYSPNSKRREVLGLVGWIALCFAASASAVWIPIDGWYTGLNKPSWNPPAWIFGPVWTLLYFMMALAAWMIWREGGWKLQGRPLGLFLLQWMLNALWTPIFFGLHQPGWALVEIILLALALGITLREFWRVKRGAGCLLIPYFLWVLFAAFLNFTLWRMNP